MKWLPVNFLYGLHSSSLFLLVIFTHRFASSQIEPVDAGQTRLRKRDRVLTDFYPNNIEIP